MWTAEAIAETLTVVRLLVAMQQRQAVSLCAQTSLLQLNPQGVVAHGLGQDTGLVAD